MAEVNAAKEVKKKSWLCSFIS